MLETSQLGFFDTTIATNFIFKQKLGISCYGEDDVLYSEKDFGVRTYRFGVLIQLRKEKIKNHEWSNYIPSLECQQDFDKYWEYITFIHTCDLKDYTTKRKLKVFSDDEGTIIYDFDWDRILKEVVPEEYDKAKERLERKNKNIIREKVCYIPKEGCEMYYNDYEFLEFTEETAFNWASSFNQDGKEGAILSVTIRESVEYPTLDVYESFSCYDLPDSLKGKNGEFKLLELGDDLKGKRELFNSFTVAQRHQIAKSYYKNKLCFLELPCIIYLTGTDDNSMHKHFATTDKVEKELEYLRKMQPLDYQKDLIDRGYQYW